MAETQLMLISHLSSSLMLIFQAYIPAAILGIAIGRLIALTGTFYRVFQQLLQVPATIPSIALMPVALMALQKSQPAALLLVFFSGIWPVAVNTAAGMRLWQKNRQRAGIYDIVAGLRLGMGVAWWTVIAVEMLIGGKGIGFFLFDAYNSNNPDSIIKAIACISIVGFLLDRLIDFAGYRILQLFPEEEPTERAGGDIW